MVSSILQRTCLRPNRSLRQQLIVSYGSTAFFTILVVVLMATIAAILAGEGVKPDTRELLTDQLIDNLQTSGLLMARIFSQRFTNLRTSSTLLVEVVRDRIVGYPNEFADDRYVPFIDTETGTRQYPLKANLLPRDWQIIPNVNLDNLLEHVQQERVEFFSPVVNFMSTASAQFSFAGNCNPEHTTPNMPGYFPLCTDDYNNATLGGMINPTPTLAALEQKAADIGVFMKPIWESEPSAMQAGVYFHNSGAGAYLGYPSFHASSAQFYNSSGCEWMRELNNYTNKPFGTEEEIARCNPSGSQVPMRLYNPMERKFCADQALHPGKSRIFGPYLSPLLGQWRISIGKAVYDRKTKEFIACASLDLSLESATGLLNSSSDNNRTDLLITRLDGTVVTGTGIDFKNRTETFKILDTDFIDEETLSKLTREITFWERVWDPQLISDTLLQNTAQSAGKMYSVFPSPPPPDVYDPSYEPDFLIFGAVRIEDVFGIVEEIENEIDYSEKKVIIVIVGIGVVGLLFLLAFVWIVAQVLTHPLQWMEATAWKIVNHADERVGENLTIVEERKDYSLNPLARCLPRTEVSELVSEFQSMISGFSGEGASKVASSRVSEVRNTVTWKDEFREVYTVRPQQESSRAEDCANSEQYVSRRMSNTRTSLTKVDVESFAKLAGLQSEAEFRSAELIVDSDKVFRACGEPSAELTSTKRSPLSMESAEFDEYGRPVIRLNLGSNIIQTSEKRQTDAFDGRSRISRSRLFWSILSWIVCPILLTIATISTIVAWRLNNVFPAWIDSAKDTSFALAFEKLGRSCELRALYTEQVMPGPLRDLHVATRIAGWLLFGAINRSSSFTEMEIEMVEECKVYSEDEVCPFESDESRSPCDCKWDDPWNRTCTIHPEDSRYDQRMWYINQNRDYDPDTGRRNESTSFPEYDFSAATTSWFTDVDEMPGSYKGENASGHATTYDRIRVISALSTAVFPIYNHDIEGGVRQSKAAMSTYVGFEADGSYLGYAGCNYDFARYASFKSSEDNQAYVINEALCPKGKFGYDVRCRPWYNDAKQEALNDGSGVYVSPPYQFATVTFVGTTAASPLIDPSTGEFVGGTSVDFEMSDVFKIMDEAKDYCNTYAVTMPNVPPNSNTVAASNMPRNSTAEALEEVLLPYDSPQGKNREALFSIMERMSEEKTGTATLNITNADGVEEIFSLVHSPIYIRELRPSRPDNFTRGANASISHLYSLVMIKKESALYGSFSAIADDIEQDLERTSNVFLVVTALVTVVCILLTARISVAVTKPMIQLLEVVKQVNAGRVEDDMPPLSGGSREVHRVYTSFAKLYKIVRISNSAFFSGDFIWAHHIGNDALQLFRKIGDRKAIAIACNNIGNTLLVLMVERRKQGNCLNLDGSCCSKTALKHFDEAVASAKEDFDNAESDEEKTMFAQQLSDRHFNRAVCLLLAGDDPCISSASKELAMADLLLSYQYDAGVKEYMMHSKTLFKNMDVIFARSIRRLYGLATLSSFIDDISLVWDVYELLDQVDLILQAAWNHDEAPLFKDVSKVGRLQELEGAAGVVELSYGNVRDAAVLATRSLVEDEYIIDSAFEAMAECLLRYTRGPGLANGWSINTITSLREDLKKMRKSGRNTVVDIGRSFVFCVELDRTKHETSVLDRLYNECMAFYDENTIGTDSVGLATLTSHEMGIVLTPCTKAENQDALKDRIESAIAGVNSPISDPMLPVAIKMILDVASSTANDVYLIYISDGSTWTSDQSYVSLKEKVREANERRNASIDVISIGLDVQDSAFEENCRDLCLATRSRNSMQISVAAKGEANDTSVEDAFEYATSLVNSHTSFRGTMLKRGLTMEKF